MCSDWPSNGRINPAAEAKGQTSGGQRTRTKRPAATGAAESGASPPIGRSVARLVAQFAHRANGKLRARSVAVAQRSKTERHNSRRPNGNAQTHTHSRLEPLTCARELISSSRRATRARQPKAPTRGHLAASDESVSCDLVCLLKLVAGFNRQKLPTGAPANGPPCRLRVRLRVGRLICCCCRRAVAVWRRQRVTNYGSKTDQTLRQALDRSLARTAPASAPADRVVRKLS